MQKGRRRSVASGRAKAGGHDSRTYAAVGYQGGNGEARTHFAATSDQWGKEEVGEAMVATAVTIATERGSGNQGKKIYFPEDSGNAKGGNSPGQCIDKRKYTEISRILGRYMSPFEMFGALGRANGKHIGNKDSDLRSGFGSGDWPSRCIYVPAVR